MSQCTSRDMGARRNFLQWGEVVQKMPHCASHMSGEKCRLHGENVSTGEARVAPTGPP